MAKCERLCIDVRVPEDGIEQFDRIWARVNERKPKKGSLFVRDWLHDNTRKSSLRGSEVNALTQMVEKQIPVGRKISIDGLTAVPKSINVAMVVEEGVAEKIDSEGLHYLRYCIDD